MRPIFYVVFGIPWLTGLGLTLAVMWISLKPLQDNPELIGEAVAERISLQSEEWITMPLKYMTTQEPLWMRRFGERQQLLENELKRLAPYTPSLKDASTRAAVELEAVRLAAQNTMTAAVGAEQERATTEYLTTAAKFTDAILVTSLKVREHDAEHLRQDEMVRQGRLFVGLCGTLFLVLWSLGGLSYAHRVRARFLGTVVARADRDTRSESQELAEIKPANLERLSSAVESLAERLAQQRESTQFQIRQQDMLRDFTEALETTDDEGEVLQLLHRMLELRHPGRTVQVLLTDPSEAELRPAFPDLHPHQNCTPGSPARCKALRMGRALRVDENDSMTTCPRMPVDSKTFYSCIPLTIGGRSASTVRLMSDERAITTADVLDVATVSQRFAVRLGVIRLLATTSRQARTDALTGIANRRVLLDTLGTAITQTRTERGGLVAVLALDLDHFKRLNDTYGHAAGDAALRRFVQAVKSVMPEDGILGRTGGEEFVAFRPVDNVGAGMELAHKIIEAVREIVQAGTAPATTVSIGVSFAPQDGETVEEALAVADERLYQAKEGGRDRAVGPLSLSGKSAA